MSAVYFDNNATTPLDPRVREAMLPWLGERWGNPSSVHGFGRAAREAVEAARAEVAALVGGGPEEVVFTSSGTESNNAVLWHAARACGFRGHLVLSALEHPSLRVLAEDLAELGVETTLVAPGADGRVAPDAVRESLRADTRIVCLMSANNEIGTLQPVAEVAAVCRQAGVPLHCDAAQSLGKVAVDVGELGADWMTLAAHKFHGPLGAAALWVRSGAELRPWILGGGQERRRRASTENVAGIVGFGEAARLARLELEQRGRHLRELRDRFEEGVTAIPDAVIHCRRSPRLPHTSHVAFPGLEGEALTIRLDLAGFAVSTGSACASGVVEPSPTLLAMGVAADEALASLRISFGTTNTLAEVDAFLEVLPREVAALRRLTPALGGGA
ncbi:MAG: cysteine desulfurase family protein [Thermoanaerobaculia bacterium]|nr:cysteine desulfurase family protein [Thermoanaerobaculia bacterium]